MDTYKGLKGRTQWLTDDSMSAASAGSGLLRVFSTPHLVALMELAALNALEGKLAPGETTVGTEIHVKHIAATPIGMRVFAEAELTACEGRAYHFHITASDEAGRIGEAEHTRFVVNSARFMEKTEAKSTKG